MEKSWENFVCLPTFWETYKIFSRFFPVYVADVQGKTQNHRLLCNQVSAISLTSSTFSFLGLKSLGGLAN